MAPDGGRRRRPSRQAPWNQRLGPWDWAAARRVRCGRAYMQPEARMLWLALGGGRVGPPAVAMAG
eukprot:11200256-Lingulodinium_polyedra.AAC.1